MDNLITNEKIRWKKLSHGNVIIILMLITNWKQRKY